MNLINSSLLASLLRSRRLNVRVGREDERLRRAGYLDGERLPAIRYHWTNR